MADEVKEQTINNTLGQLKNPVRLAVFTSDIGCERCPEVLSLARSIKSRSPKIGLEVYDLTMDRDKTEQYGVSLAPSLVVQGAEGQSATFCGAVEGITIGLLLEAILAVSTGRVWFPDNIRNTLKLLEQDVHIQVFLDNDCSQCRPVAETAMGLSLESPFIHADIIVADDFPKLAEKYKITTLPKTVFGGNLHMDGHVTESAFLEMIFEAEGLKPGPGRRCLVCGNPSADVICASCKSKIQAEAVEHKQRDEKLRRADR